jgi:hypothetical protein
MTPARRTIGILLIVAGAASGFGYVVVALVTAFSTLERFDAPGGREATLEVGDYTVYWETPGMFAADRARGPDVLVRVVARDGQESPAVNAAGLWVSHYSTGSRVGVSIADFRVERRGVYDVSAVAVPGKTLPGGGIAITRSMGMPGVYRLVLTTLALVGAGVGGGIFVLLKKRTTAPAA